LREKERKKREMKKKEKRRKPWWFFTLGNGKAHPSPSLLSTYHTKTLPLCQIHKLLTKVQRRDKEHSFRNLHPYLYEV
jgi:hypothetical protein